MDAKIKAKWLEALRSGKYKQAEGALRDGNKFCCLGVLCDLYGKQNKLEWKKDKWGEWMLGRLKQKEVLPQAVQRWAKLAQPNPSTKDDEGYVEKLADMNDGGYSFKRIARRIEEQL